MTNLGDLIDFVQELTSNIAGFSISVFNFLTYNVPVLEITIFELLLTAGVTTFLVTTIAKWLIGVVS